MSSFTHETSEALVLRLEDPHRLNDFRSDDYRETLFQTVQSLDVPQVALDLSQVDYLSSSGVAILVGLKRRIDARQGKLVLFQIQPLIEDLLRVMKLHTYFTIAATEQDALALLRPSGAD